MGAQRTILEFNLSGSTAQCLNNQKFVLAPLAKGWLEPGRKKISIVLDGIASSDDRKRLQLALKKFLPVYRIDPAVSAELDLSIRHSTFTELWLDDLHAAARKRDNSLCAGDSLRNGQFEIICEMAAGGQAIVYEANDYGSTPNSNNAVREVVLKEFVLPAYAGPIVRKRVLENIQQEGELLKSLKHPNIVKLLDIFVEDERAYLVLEKIRGTTIKKLVETKGPLPEEQVVMLGLQMCEILGYLHAHKVVHRDFSPDNLILGHGDILKLIDFNVAQQREGDSVKSVVGKHSYIPPEQFRGRATAQSDLYAAGATMHFMLTGKEPEPIACSHPRLLRESVRAALDECVARATAIDLGERYANCVELRNDLYRLKTANST
jgi:serine/threonine protein kinase